MIAGGELVANLDAQRNVLSVSGETLPDAKVDTSPRISSSAARDAAKAAIAEGESVSGARLDAGIPEPRDLRRAAARRPRARTSRRSCGRLEVKGRAGLLIDQLVLVDAQTGSVALNIDQIETRQEPLGLRRATTSRRPQVPCTAPVRAPRPARRTPATDADVAQRLRVRRRDLRLLLRRASAATASTTRACR